MAGNYRRKKMSAKIIDGKATADQIKSELQKEIIDLKKDGIVPGLAAVLVGDDMASSIYVRSKAKACEQIGIYSEVMKFPQNMTEEKLLDVINELNNRLDINGILVQLPLPKQINEEEIIVAVDPKKDVDGFHPFNVGMMWAGKPTFLPCTPYGIQELLVRNGYDPSGKHVVILGRGSLVGKPLATMLVQKAKGANATVTVCHTGTVDMKYFSKQADILISAIGKAYFVGKDMVKPGAIVVDVGINRLEDKTKEKGYRVVGDVNFEEVSEIAGAITPVPGGVGPMTIAMLLTNTAKAAKKQAA
jgi:methylenetetrahydrofolate dehydrogenase (NADP+) / methenyltetrahydrofolate cyclohydrolase